MTTLFNLESYSQFCYYTQNLSNSSLTVESGLPTGYLSFLKSARKHFLEITSIHRGIAN